MVKLEVVGDHFQARDPGSSFRGRAAWLVFSCRCHCRPIWSDSERSRACVADGPCN